LNGPSLEYYAFDFTIPRFPFDSRENDFRFFPSDALSTRAKATFHSSSNQSTRFYNDRNEIYELQSDEATTSWNEKGRFIRFWRKLQQP